MTYNFLFIAIITLIPTVLIYILRPKLRGVIHVMSPASIPFAFTEWLFYPEYWEPVFLFNLVDYIGFGIEDILFVMGLGGFASTLYAAVFKQIYLPKDWQSRQDLLKRIMATFIVTLVLITAAVLAEIPMIYGSVGIMLVMAIAIVTRRTDLLKPALWGGLLTTLVYTGLCFVILVIYPEIFDLTWHTEHFLNLYMFGIPLEEIFYAFSAGMLATIAYPYLFKMSFLSKA